MVDSPRDTLAVGEYGGGESDTPVDIGDSLDIDGTGDTIDALVVRVWEGWVYYSESPVCSIPQSLLLCAARRSCQLQPPISRFLIS